MVIGIDATDAALVEEVGNDDADDAFVMEKVDALVDNNLAKTGSPQKTDESSNGIDVKEVTPIDEAETDGAVALSKEANE
eukprot:9683104-Ditylum_brightwellii.AAC.1